MGKINVDQSWDEQGFLEEAKTFQLVYIFSQSELKYSSETVRLVDIKATFFKRLDQSADGCSSLERPNGELDQRLVKLAFESGAYSRFKVDERLDNEEFEKLYRLWIQKAWENREILSLPEKEGMVTVSIDGDSGKIGLLAVHPDSRGKGWGKKLVKAAEMQAKREGAQGLYIPTQLDNLPACHLYQSTGYTLSQKEYIYHYWRN